MAERIKYLYESLEAEKKAIAKYQPDIIKIPDYISENLKYPFFDWQKKAFENLLIAEEDHKENPTHLMFNMATGTGKTLLMAACLLYYYKQGYKQFIFFVNQNNIVDKTENNFIDSNHNKYLFKENIAIDDKNIDIKKVETFSNDPQAIEIKFTTIQKLYNDIHLERENQTTLKDLNNKNIVLFADEAHHLNANTKIKKGEQLPLDLPQLTLDFDLPKLPKLPKLPLDSPIELKNSASQKDIEKKGWEHTVIELILHKNNNSQDNKNVLLEFTATIPENDQVAKKYEDKMLYQFGLKEFLRAGYTKEINLISSTLDKKKRILHALVFNWYRHKIALKHDIINFKAVILFRSKFIKESAKDYQEFCNMISNITKDDFNFLNSIAQTISQSKKIYEQGQSRTNDVLEFIGSNNIGYGEIVDWIKANFQEKNTIITNSKNGTKTKEQTTDEQEKLLNNLEDKDNHIRAIFTVKRLTEGWDVQNLFDIVRLDESQNTGGATDKRGTTPEATVQEKQLIGRGIRYYPFAHGDKVKNKRKFDNDTRHELRILEELYYYAYDEDAKYISHLSQELKKDGYITDDRELKEFAVKEAFKQSDFYAKTKVWYNKQENNPDRKKGELRSMSITYKTQALSSLKQQEVNLEGDDRKKTVPEPNHKPVNIDLKDIDVHIFNKAINVKAQQSNSLFRFERLKQELGISSIDDLLRDKFLDGSYISFICDKESNISNEDKLKAALRLLTKVFANLEKDITPNIGGEFMPDTFDNVFGKPKTKYIDASTFSDSKDVVNKDWYILDGYSGTGEEDNLIKFITSKIGNLEDKYKEVYLLRNEEVYKIYDFKTGRGFQPDFILFLKHKDKHLYYQVFIEPKGKHLIEHDKWKEDFLSDISARYGKNNILKEENEDYRLIGLPFFNGANKLESFKSKLDEEILVPK